ncbi:hypothetical protein CHU98_g3767 [Xylaria longipes]|nr:hypothetical protein CHU98_g3767 [Xylaria longipes]
MRRAVGPRAETPNLARCRTYTMLSQNTTVNSAPRMRPSMTLGPGMGCSVTTRASANRSSNRCDPIMSQSPNPIASLLRRLATDTLIP